MKSNSLFKKTKDQSGILDHLYDENPTWSKSKIKEIAGILSMKESQIYKWHWDRSQSVHKRFQKSLRKINEKRT